MDTHPAGDHCRRITTCRDIGFCALLPAQRIHVRLVAGCRELHLPQHHYLGWHRAGQGVELRDQDHDRWPLGGVMRLRRGSH